MCRILNTDHICFCQLIRRTLLSSRSERKLILKGAFFLKLNAVNASGPRPLVALYFIWLEYMCAFATSSVIDKN